METTNTIIYALPEPILQGIEYIQNSETIVIVAVVIVIAFIVNFIFDKFKAEDKKEEVVPIEIEIPDPKPNKLIDLNEGQDSINFLERLIKEKYNYYMYLELLPIYIEQKIPEKKLIEEVKSKIYANVVGSLTRDVKQELLRFFTDKGIEIYVNEQIIILMNQTDFKASEKITESFREITPGTIDKIL